MTLKSDFGFDLQYLILLPRVKIKKSDEGRHIIHRKKGGPTDRYTD